MAQILGGTLGSYIILHLILLAYRETKHVTCPQEWYHILC